jgi:hypothetical protein
MTPSASKTVSGVTGSLKTTRTSASIGASCNTSRRLPFARLREPLPPGLSG